MSKRRDIFLFTILIVLLLCLFGFLGKSKPEAEEVPKPGVVASPKIFAHRGAINQFNENTITAYKIASEENVDAIEIDLRMTKDNVLIAMHDETIDRTTNGTGRVSELTLRDIKSCVTLGLYNGEITMEEIPTLGEVFQAFGGSQKFYIETRLVYGETAMEEVLVRMLSDYNLLDKEKVAIQSFSVESLEKMADLAPDLRLTLLFREGEFELDKALEVDFPVIGMESTDVTAEAVNALHSQGKEVHVFFNDSETMEEQQEKMKQLNIDGYFTDNISYTKRLLGK
ncbi:glycerophosphodiester phosphodiesterase family protein [Lysinibacillus sp. SGAir0095]|uniref:glycerophosphodiester phosphodiesterase n=1 Tax=Lysinibacillus sp. SGAir0095 TaxID=2070463 RepID=UPI0010CD5208|nr:glycerophosphodiester phosphodiesterase family protein [Lysinibacillus sp. SGAir0095]QCR34145.1 glycerophosphodiester phosphodiesterase [Lysinibacillus sp. SGAir0095]